MIKVKTIKKELLFAAVLIAAAVICLILTTENVHGLTSAPGGNVKNVQELNAALGGNHKVVSDNTIVMEDDVALEASIDITNAEEPLTIDMTKHKLSF